MAAALSSASARVLFVEDDADVQKAANLLLPRHGFTLLCACNPDEAWSVLGREAIDVVLLDLNFQPGARSGAEGFACLERLIAHDPELVVVVVTGHSGINIAVAAMRAGAADFVMKPWSNERLVATLTDAAALAQRRREARTGGDPTDPDQPAGIRDGTPVVVGESPSIQRVLAHMRRAAPTDASILLLGEAGTGKSLLAHTIHRLSSRAGRKLATRDPAATWNGGEASFGEAFGKIDAEGTLFLDEIAGLSLVLQAALLDFLRTRPRLRLLAATRATRDALIGGALHPDLLYRLNTVELALPPLRDRGDDIALLAAHFLRLFAGRYRRSALAFSPEASAAIAAAPWTGNVRALAHAVERAVVLAQHGVLHPQDIPLPAPLPGGIDALIPGSDDLNLSRSEKAMVEAALRRHGFNVSQAAKELGLTRAALYRRMARHGL